MIPLGLSFISNILYVTWKYGNNYFSTDVNHSIVSVAMGDQTTYEVYNCWQPHRTHVKLRLIYCSKYLENDAKFNINVVFFTLFGLIYEETF